MTIDSIRRSLAIGFDRWAPEEGTTSSRVPGLTFHRHTAPTPPYVGILDASLSVVVAGRKRVVLSKHTFDYGNTQFLITPIDLPVTACVTEASESEPYLGMLLRIDLAVVRELFLGIRQQRLVGAPTTIGITRAEITPDLLDSLFRLCRLEERPEEVVLFGEQLQREVLYRLIMSPIGPHLCSLASADGISNGVVKAVQWLRRNFRERQSTDALAEVAGMGVSTLHRHFKAVTAMSPVQYRKYMQLTEARRLMLVEGLDAASAAFDVGYESPSQFSREYRRTFGQPPFTNITSLKRSFRVGDPVTRLS